MRIAHVIDYFQPQLGYQETYLARQQIEDGHDVLVITSDRYRPNFFAGDAAQHILGDRIMPTGLTHEEGVHVRRLPITCEAGRRVWLRGLSSALRGFQPDVIHVHGYLTATTLKTVMHCVFFRRSRPVVIVDDHMYPEASGISVDSVYWPVRRLFTPFITWAGVQLVAVSHASREYMCERYGVPRDSISIIPLGVDTQLFQPSPSSRQVVRQKLGLDQDSVVLLYTGRIMPRKRVDTLIHALAEVVQVLPTVQLVLVGYSDVAYERDLKQLIDNCTLQDHVTWCPATAQSELASYFAAADVAIWPAEHSISFLEAMATGLPLIVSDAPRALENVAFGNGFAFPAGDEGALSERIIELVKDRLLRERMGRASRKVAEAVFDWRVINRRFVELYMTKDR